MFSFLKKAFLIVLVLVFCLALFGKVRNDKLRIEDYQVFIDDQRTAIRGGSEYHFISDPAIYPLILPDNFDILIQGNNPGTKTNLLRVWMEGMANSSGTWKSGDDPHPLLGTVSYPDYAEREQQPFMVRPGFGTRPYCKYNLNDWPDDIWEDQPNYKYRLEKFIEKAKERDVIVMLTLFDACMKCYSWETSAWHPDRNTDDYGVSLTAPYLDAGNPYPTGGANPKAFYNIWVWNGNEMTNNLNGLGELQKGYVQRVVNAIPASHWNVWFEIENEPHEVIAESSGVNINLTAKWAYTVAGWIKEARNSSVIAYNAWGPSSTRETLFALENSYGQRIDVITIHADTRNYGDGDDYWSMQDPDSPDWLDYIENSIKIGIGRIRDNSSSRFFIIDSDGDYNDYYDLDPAKLAVVSGCASLFGAGYNNKSATIVDYDEPVFNIPFLKDLNDAITLPFFDLAGGTKYGSYLTYPIYRRGFFNNNVLRNIMPVPMIVSKGVPYSLNILVVNNGTWDNFSDIGGSLDLFLRDKTTGVTAIIAPDLQKVTPPTAWTIPPLDLGSSHKTTITMPMPAIEDETSIVHEIVIIKSNGIIKQEIGGDTLRVQAFAQ